MCVTPSGQVLHQVPRFSHQFRNSNWGPFDTQEAKCGVYERFGCHSRGDSARLMTHDSLHPCYFFCVSHSIVPHSLRVSPYHTRLWQELPVCTKKFETQSHEFCWVETLVMIPEVWGPTFVAEWRTGICNSLEICNMISWYKPREANIYIHTRLIHTYEYIYYIMHIYIYIVELHRCRINVYPQGWRWTSCAFTVLLHASPTKPSGAETPTRHGSQAMGMASNHHEMVTGHGVMVIQPACLRDFLVGWWPFPIIWVGLPSGYD